MKSSYFLPIIFFGLLLGPQPICGQTTALDFTMRDSKGRTWTLFEELAKGKTVMLDFFFVTCVPCQTWTPQIAQMYIDLGKDSSDILILGISDRDNNASIDVFDSTYGVNYPTAGIEGGGDTITSKYTSFFPFFGWPSYAVICPDTTITWDIRPVSTGLPEIRAAIADCGQASGNNFEATTKQPELMVFPIPAKDHLQIQLQDFSINDVVINLCSTLGTIIAIYSGKVEHSLSLDVAVDELSNGIYFIIVSHENGILKRQLFITNH